MLQQALDVLQSEDMFLVLSNMTGLTLHELAPNNDSDDEGERASSSNAMDDGQTSSDYKEADREHSDSPNADSEAKSSEEKHLNKKLKLDAAEQDDNVSSTDEESSASKSRGIIIEYRIIDAQFS